MAGLKHIFKVKTFHQHTRAELWLHDTYDQTKLQEMTWTEKDVLQFLQEQRITYGIQEEVVRKLVNEKADIAFPLLIAEGKQPVNGKDGSMSYFYDRTTEVDRSAGWNFREVMRIPAVESGQKLAKLHPPTPGEPGRTVDDQVLKAKPGKPLRIKAGENTVFNQEDQCFYAKSEGKVNISHHAVHVHEVYEVTDGISLKTGNIHFLGTVIIHGDVPSGFKIKATGDVQVFGMVEAAEIEADGSVYISEGFAGLKKGSIRAEENVYLGYSNQGDIVAGGGIYADHSIRHSICTANYDITCPKGIIIGGMLSAGFKIEAREIGNRLHTLTELSFGVDKANLNEAKRLKEEEETLQENLRKITLLKSKLSEADQSTSKTRVTLLKVRHSYQQTKEKLTQVQEKMTSLKVEMGRMEDAYLRVNEVLYPNTVVTFGKYQRTIERNYSSVGLKIEQNDIKIRSL